MDKQKTDQLKDLWHMAGALLDSMNVVLHSSSGADDFSKLLGYKDYARKYNQLVEAVTRLIPNDTFPLDRFDLDKLPGLGDLYRGQEAMYFSSVHSSASILKAYLENKLNLKDDEVANLANFLQSNLRRVIFRAPERELEIQDAIESLLIGHGLAKGLDYDRETGRVKVSVKEAVPDFIFPRLGLALEVKLTKDVAKVKTIVDEINADILAYRKAYSSLLFVVYDMGSIRDELEFKQGLETQERTSVIVVKH